MESDAPAMKEAMKASPPLTLRAASAPPADLHTSSPLMLQEKIYVSAKREALGKPLDRGHMLPDTVKGPGGYRCQASENSSPASR
jgi:hypothetical protein